MRTDLKSPVLTTLRRHQMLRAGDRVGVACSGGADSTALLLLLLELRAELGITLLALHFHHQLRGAEADADELFVRDLAARHGLEMVAVRADVAAEAKTKRENLEATGRRLRYDFFRSVVAEGRASRVAVAHTADDQAETVLAHLLRGTGIAGLAGIYPVAGPLIRPLLDIRRSALREYLVARGQTWREDASNADTSRLRARIRHRLLPGIQREFQPHITEHLASLATLARRDEEFFEFLLDGVLEKKALKSEQGLSIRISDISYPFGPEPTAPGTLWVQRPDAVRGILAPEGFQRRLIRRMVQGVAGDRHRLTAKHIEQVTQLALGGSGGRQIQLPGGIVVERGLDGQIHFSRRDSGTVPAAQTYEYVVEARPGGAQAVELPGSRKRLCLKVIDWPAAARETKESQTALDFGLLQAPLVLRNWRPGDAYRPAGRKQAHKLKELFQRRLIRAQDRAGWPVLSSNGRVAWAAGFPAGAEFAATPATRVALVIIEE